MKNLFLIGLAIGAAYSAFDTIAATQQVMREQSSFESDTCIQTIDAKNDNEVTETCKEIN